MNQQKKNFRLIGILVGLIVVIAGLAMWSPGASKTNMDEMMFTLKTGVQFDKIVITGNNVKNLIEKKTAGWTINREHRADPYLIELFGSVMTRNRVKRKIAQSQTEEIMQLLEAGVMVGIFQDGQSLLAFKVGGDRTQKITYFQNPDQGHGYLVNIPGYNEYLAALFEMTENQWRDRSVFSSTWQSIRRLEVNYADPETESFTIRYERDFLQVDGIEQLDTGVMMHYVENYNLLAADGYIKKEEYPRYDSLLDHSTALAQISLMDIDPSRNNRLTIYPRIGRDPYYLALVGGTDMALFQVSKIDSLLKKMDDFQRSQ